jgi:hypothetical protein
VLWNLVIALLMLAGSFTAAAADRLTVGANQQYKEPSQAIAAAHDGDTVSIDQGTYIDCAIVQPTHLTIEGVGPNVMLTDKACAGKAILVVNGNDIIIRNLTLQRVRVPDLNGAGIRAEGGNLTVDNVRFINNQDGILSAENRQATIKIMNSQFVDNGGCYPRGVCAHALYAGSIGELQVENSRFYDNHGGHNIKSRALKTEVLNCDIEDGPAGSSSYLIDVPNGGTAIINGNTLEKGRQTENRDSTIMIGEEGVTHPTDELIIKNNRLTNNTGRQIIFVHNITATPAQLSGNVFSGGIVIPLRGGWFDQITLALARNASQTAHLALALAHKLLPP